MKNIIVLAVLASSTAHAEPPKLLVGTDPLGILDDSYALTGTYGFSDQVAVRAEVQVQHQQFTSMWHYRVSLPIYLDRAFHGPFVEPGLVETRGSLLTGLSFDAANQVHPQTADVRTFGPSIMVGYQWTFHDRYSLAAAYGVSKAWSSNIGGALDDGRQWYVRAGWLF